MKTCKRCKRCFREFEEEDTDISPPEELADLFLQDIGTEDINDLCPQYREDLGVVNMLGGRPRIQSLANNLFGNKYQISSNHFMKSHCPQQKSPSGY